MTVWPSRCTTTWLRSVGHKVIATIEQVLADAKAQGLVGRNAAELVNRVAPAHTDPGVLGVAERVDWTTHCCLLILNRRAVTTLQTDAHKMGREERRALPEQRR